MLIRVAMDSAKQSDAQKSLTAMSTYQPDLWQSIVINGTAISAATAVSQADALCTGNANTIIYTDR